MLFVLKLKKLGIDDVNTKKMEKALDFYRNKKVINQGDMVKIAKKFDVSYNTFQGTLFKKDYRKKIPLKYGSEAERKAAVANARSDALKLYSSPKYENFIRGTLKTPLGHISDIYSQPVTTQDVGYVPKAINEALDQIDAQHRAIYKKRNNLFKNKPKGWQKEVERLNAKGIALAQQSQGYKNFNIKRVDGSTYKFGVEKMKTIDPMDLVGEKKLTDLTKADKDLIELNRKAVFEAQDEIGKRQINKMNKMIQQLGCGLHSGGRVAFANAGKVDCFGKGLEKIKTGNIATKGDAAVMKKIVEVGAKKGAARTAMIWLGPLGLGGDVLFEAGDIAAQMLGGKPLDEALRNNWITGMFTEGTEKEARDIKVFKDTGPGAKRYVEGSDAYNKLQSMYKVLDVMKQKQSGSRGKITDADIKKQEQDIEAQKRYVIMLDKKESGIYRRSW